MIVSASVGAGHNNAAAELADRLTGAGHRVDVHDLVDLLPAPLGPGLASGYQWQAGSAPWAWDATVAAFDRGLGTRLAARCTRAADREIMALLRPDTAAVVSTYPLASQVLGRLRRSGTLRVPAVTYLTDPYAHRTWIAPGVDAHLATCLPAAARASSLGAAGVRVVAPAVPARFRPARDAAEVAEARQAFQLPSGGRLALIVTGSLGLGHPERAAVEVAATGLATPVVVCGKELALRRRLTGTDGVITFGWVDDMPTLMRAADVVIHNAGGLSSLEALATGLPLLTYRALAGHGRHNAAVLDQIGLSRWVRRREQLPEALRGAFSATPPPFAGTDDPADVIAALARPPQRHIGRRLVRPVAGAPRPPGRGR